jgi:hypothetical protein
MPDPRTDNATVARSYAAELTAMAREVIAANRYLVLGTAHADGHPRVSPVYFNHDEHRRFYWVSAPDAQHSRNIAADPAIPSGGWASTPGCLSSWRSPGRRGTGATG